MFVIKSRFMRIIPLVGLLLAACTLHKLEESAPDVTPLQWQQHQQRVEKISHYQTQGAFAWLSNERKVYARFNWQQKAPDRYRLLLTNPLGHTELQLDVQGSVVQLVDSKGKRYVGDNAQAMISQLTGMDIPLDNLRKWMMGLPGDADDYQLNEHYQLQQLVYQRHGTRWQVNWQNYDNNITPELPEKLELRTDTQRIKLRMDSWTVQ